MFGIFKKKKTVKPQPSTNKKEVKKATVKKTVAPTSNKNKAPKTKKKIIDVKIKKN